MTWHTLTHGTNGLILAYGLALVASAATLIKQRAAIGTLLLTPIVAVPSALSPWRRWLPSPPCLAKMGG